MIQDLTSKWSATAIHAAGAGTCLALLGVGYLLGVRPLLSSGDASQAGLQETLHEAEADAAFHAAAVERLERDLMESEQELNARPMNLLHASAVNRRLAGLSELARAHGLALAESRPGEETMLEFYAYVPIDLGGTGQLGDVVRFLGALNTAFPDMGVQSFQVSRGPLGNGQFSLTLNWFVRPTQTAEVS